MGFIYKITNDVNGKMYIGKTQDSDPYDRWKDHLSDYKKQRTEKRPLYAAMNKYGIEHFQFEVIDECSDGSDLCLLERSYVEKYRTYVGFKDCVGYNGTLGGDGKPYLNLNEEDVIKSHIANNYLVGKTAKDYNVDRKTITKILKKHNIKWLSSSDVARIQFKDNYGGLVQIDGDGKNIVYIYEVPKDAVKNNSFKYSTLSVAYSGRCKSKSHKAYGYIWYRLNELPEEYKPLLEEYYKTHN